MHDDAVDWDKTIHDGSRTFIGAGTDPNWFSPIGPKCNLSHLGIVVNPIQMPSETM